MEREIGIDGINLSYQKWQKEKRYNPTSEFNVIKVLSSYNEVLYKRNINREKDEIYYNFIQTLGRCIPKQSTKDDWIQYCEKLFHTNQSDNQKEEQQNNQQKRTNNLQMNSYYNDRLMLRIIQVWFEYAQQKNQTKSRKQHNNSLINQQDQFIPEEDSYIQYKRNKYQKNSNIKYDCESSPKQNINSYQEHLPQQKEIQNIKSTQLNSTPTKDYQDFNSNYLIKEVKNKDSSFSREQNNEYKKQIHFDSIRQFTDTETIDHQLRKNNESFQQNQQQKFISLNSPSYCPIQSTNSFALQNGNTLVISPNSSSRNNQLKSNRNLNSQSFRQSKETISVNEEKQCSQRTNSNTFRNNIFNQSVKNQINNNKNTKILINSMYDNLDNFETNMDELGENAINLSKISADFESSCIYKQKDNTKYIDESYSLHQNNQNTRKTNNIFQTYQDVETDELSFHQQDFQSTLPNYTQKSYFGDNTQKQLQTQQTTKNLTSISPKNRINPSYYNLDFKVLKDNIKTMSLYFSKLQLYKEKQKKKKLQLPQKLNLDQQVKKYYIRQLKDKVFCILKAFCIVSGETQERYNYIKSNHEFKMKSNYLNRFIQKYNQRIQKKVQEQCIQNNIKLYMLNKAFISLKKYHELQQQKQMQANQLIYSSRTAIDFIIDLYLKSQLTYSYQHNKIYEIFQNCSRNMNYKPLVTSLTKNQILNERNSKQLSKQTDNVILTIKYNTFQVLKSLYDRNNQATNLYNLKKAQKIFSVLKNNSNERIQLKEGLEKFISCKLQDNQTYILKLIFIHESISYQFNLLNKRYSCIANVMSEWKRITAQRTLLKRKGQIIFNKYKNITTKEYISKWIQNFNLSDLATIYYKNSIWKKWRTKFIDKVVFKKNRNRLQTQGMKSLILNLNKNKIKKEKIQKAEYFMYMMLFKKAQYFIEILKINKEKQFFKKQAVLNAQGIIQNVFKINNYIKNYHFIIVILYNLHQMLKLILVNLNQNLKVRILRAISEHTIKYRDQTKKIRQIRQMRIHNIKRSCFIEIMKNLANKKLTLQMIHQKIKIRIKANIRTAIHLWKEALIQEDEEREIHDKGIWLQQNLLKRRFIDSLKQNYSIIKAEQDKYLRAELFFKRQLFYKFMGVFYKSIEQNKLKMISTKFFASNILRRGFYAWKNEHISVYQERYKKVDDYSDNPFLMSDKKGQICQYEKENLDISLSNKKESKKNLECIMSYSSAKKNKLFQQNESSCLKIINNNFRK